MKTVVGLYDKLSDAHEALHELTEAGVAGEDISLLAADPDKTAGAELAQVKANNAGPASEGAVIGGVVGGLAGLVLGLSSLTIPGLGPIIAAGPLASMLVGAGLGAAGGGLLGALVGWGVPESEAGYYTEAVRRGSTLVAVRAPEADVPRIVEILNRHNLVDLQQRVTYWRQQGWVGDGINETNRPATLTAADIVHTPSEADPDEVSPYRASFERHYQHNYEGAGKPFTEYEPAYHFGYILATDDQYGKRGWSEIEPEVEERWERTFETEWQNFRDAVRHAWNEVRHDFDETGQPGRYIEYEDEFQHHYEENYAASGLPYDKYEQAYRFGAGRAMDMTQDARMRQEVWATHEPELRRFWELEYDEPWDEVADAVRYGWNMPLSTEWRH
jgi:hypothetical protein